MVVPKYNSPFIIDEAFDFGVETSRKIAETMRGRSGCKPNDMGLLAQAIKNAGDGDYLEIGTFYGATAILAYLTKQKYKLEGKIYCIDDLEYYKDERSVGDIMNNFEKFSADILLNVCKSDPFPLPNQFFNCVLIDAGHDFLSCWIDWTNVRHRTSRYVIFHDYDKDHRGVMEAVNRASNDFYPVRISDNSAILERIG